MKPGAFDPDRRWKRARLALEKASLEETASMLAALPDGRYVQWRHGRHLVMGQVIDNDRSSRVKVRGLGGREYWIHAYRILDEL